MLLLIPKGRFFTESQGGGGFPWIRPLVMLFSARLGMPNARSSMKSRGRLVLANPKLLPGLYRGSKHFLDSFLAFIQMGPAGVFDDQGFVCKNYDNTLVDFL